MKRVHSVDYVIDALKVLADNEYSLLWELVDDFECNGHKISVKSSNQFKSVIIDGVYQRIGGDVTIVANGKTYKDPLDYVRDILTDKKGANEMLDFGSGSEKEIREAIASKAGNKMNEDKTIRIFNRTDDEYQKLMAAATLLTLFKGKDCYVGETYFDYGQDWKWTTILEKDPTWGAVQVLTPKDQENIITANSAKELGDAVDKIIHKKPYTPQN